MVTGCDSGAGMGIGRLACANLTSTNAEPQVEEPVNGHTPRPERQEKENHREEWERSGRHEIIHALERVITVRRKVCDRERTEQRHGYQAGCQSGHQQQAAHGFERADEMCVESRERDVKFLEESGGAFDVCQFSLAREVELVTDQQPQPQGYGGLEEAIRPVEQF